MVPCPWSRSGGAVRVAAEAVDLAPTAGRPDQRVLRLAGIETSKAHFPVLKKSCAAHVRKRLGDSAIVWDWLGYEDTSSRMRYKHTWLRPQYREATAKRLKDFGALAA